MPNRDDFEYEFDNGAESLISSLFTNVDDDDIDKGFYFLFISDYSLRIIIVFMLKLQNVIHAYFYVCFTGLDLAYDFFVVRQKCVKFLNLRQNNALTCGGAYVCIIEQTLHL